MDIGQSTFMKSLTAWIDDVDAKTKARMRESDKIHKANMDSLRKRRDEFDKQRF